MFAKFRKGLAYVLLLYILGVIIWYGCNQLSNTTPRSLRNLHSFTGNGEIYPHSPIVGLKISLPYGKEDTSTIIHEHNYIKTSFQEKPTTSIPDFQKKTNLEQAPDFSNLELFVLFIGYPRSGSTLVGSLLDAHPQVAIANEYSVAKKFKNFTHEQRTRNYICNQLWLNSVKESVSEQRAADKKYFFHYHVPGLWQGKYEGPLKVIGDKKCTSTTRILAVREEFYQQLKDSVNLQVKFIHIIRNPFDNIATMTLRAAGPGLRMKAEAEGVKLNNRLVLQNQTKLYLTLVDMNIKLRERFPESILDIHYSKFIQDPKSELKRICHFLTVKCSSYYISTALKVIFKNETLTRRYIVWNDDIKARILEKIAETEFLQGYEFEIS